LPAGVSRPTPVVGALPQAGSGGPGSTPWATIGGMALAVCGGVLLYAGVLLRSRAERGRRFR
jgi:hypothetical protein